MSKHREGEEVAIINLVVGCCKTNRKMCTGFNKKKTMHKLYFNPVMHSGRQDHLSMLIFRDYKYEYGPFKGIEDVIFKYPPVSIHSIACLIHNGRFKTVI